ncbi:hypothetical protein SDJN02_04937, partial [Cucurbita argyrosperma subsp. argyrosperma]
MAIRGFVVMVMVAMLIVSAIAQSPSASPSLSPTKSPSKAPSISPSVESPKSSPAAAPTPASLKSPPSPPAASPSLSPSPSPSSISSPPADAPAPSGNAAASISFSMFGSVATVLYAIFGMDSILSSFILSSDIICFIGALNDIHVPNRRNQSLEWACGLGLDASSLGKCCQSSSISIAAPF